MIWFQLGVLGDTDTSAPTIRRLDCAATVRWQWQRSNHVRGGASARHCPGEAWSSSLCLHARRRQRWRRLPV